MKALLRLLFNHSEILMAAGIITILVAFIGVLDILGMIMLVAGLLLIAAATELRILKYRKEKDNQKG